MNNLKFRAWDKEAKQMFYSDFTISCTGKCYWWSGDGYNTIREDVKIMQFTGLHDKNGVEIYEGDIVKCVEMHDGNCFGNAWINNGKGITIARPLEIKKDVDNIDWDWFDDIRECPEYWEVIGNIYQNPELLNK